MTPFIHLNVFLWLKLEKKITVLIFFLNLLKITSLVLII